jgi:hypothetical protein
MSQERETPRTDALEITCNRDCANYLLDLCRQLERELAEAADYIAALSAQQEQAERRAAELERDARRYRWLRELPNADSLNVRFMGVDLDNIIDAAIESEKGDSHE